MTDADRNPGNVETAEDVDTRVSYVVQPEQWHDRLAARLSILYLLAMLVLLSSVLYQIWSGDPKLLKNITGIDLASSGKMTLFRLMAYTAIGGALGAVANGIRSIIYWHLEKQGFGGRFIWKYLSLPPLGALLAVMVYATIRAGIGSIGGNATPTEGGAQPMWAFAFGALSGYGSHKVFVWLDDKVKKLFEVPEKSEEKGVKVPDVKGKTQAEAEAALQDAGLACGKIDTTLSTDPKMEGKVVEQTPAAGSSLAPKGAVAIKIGKGKGV
ncbi:MAG TPA: PASTA domain-containing protein [Candidatus Methylomirabilis sp.]|nr:PASTA domain-containing protein [Candidatus Methylomirabilis sp.]